jgi:hypothetical protein
MAAGFEARSANAPGTAVDALGRRCEPRGPSSKFLETIVLEDPACPVLQVQATDTSNSGLGFHCHRGFRIEERVVLRMRFANAPGRLVLCRVCHCHPITAGVYQVGVQFVEALTLPSDPDFIPERWLVHAQPGVGPHNG